MIEEYPEVLFAYAGGFGDIRDITGYPDRES